MKKIIALLLALMMIATALTACGDKKDKDGEKTDETTASTVEKDEGKDDGKTEDKEEDKKSDKPGVLPEKLTATKIGSIDVDRIFTVDDWGIRYRDENDMWGTITPDGKTNSGAKWTDCQKVGYNIYGYYAVTTKDPDQMASIEDLNCYGLANAEGELLIPEKYASLDLLSERYIKVCEVTEKAESKEGALVYMSNSDWSFLPDDDDVYFKGNWYVYDLEAGALVEGVSGTKPYHVAACGDVIEYYDDNYDMQYVDANGKEWKHTWFIEEDLGIYGIKDKDKGEATVYDNNGKKLFTYDSEKYDLSASEVLYGDYFRLREYKTDEKDSSWFMDKTGKIVSAEFVIDDYNSISVVGNYIVAEGIGVCDFEGNVIYASEEDLDYFKDDMFGALYTFYNDAVVVVLDNKGNVVIEDANINIGKKCVAFKEIEGKDLAYCYADKDYTLEGKEVIGGAPFVIRVDQESDTYTELENLVDVISGEIIIEGYVDYDSALNPLAGFEDGKIGYYIYAEKEDGGYDIYEIK